MSKTLTGFAIATTLLSAGWAWADDDSTPPPPERAVVRVQRSKARSTTRAARRAVRAARAEGPTPAPTSAPPEPNRSPLIRRFGSCDAASFERLAAEMGRLAAIERCTGRGDARAASRPLTRTAPRESDLGIPEEAFDPDFDVSSR